MVEVVGGPPDRRIEKFYAFLAVGPDGLEGVIAAETIVSGKPMMMPFITSSVVAVERMVLRADEIAAETGRVYRICEFSHKRDVNGGVQAMSRDDLMREIGDRPDRKHEQANAYVENKRTFPADLLNMPDLKFSERELRWMQQAFLDGWDEAMEVRFPELLDENTALHARIVEDAERRLKKKGNDNGP